MVDAMGQWELEHGIKACYERGGERTRLKENSRGRLEFIRVQEPLRRVLP